MLSALGLGLLLVVSLPWLPRAFSTDPVVVALITGSLLVGALQCAGIVRDIDGWCVPPARTFRKCYVIEPCFP